MSAWSYDAIADVYATDMGQSMPFDDIRWYRELCLAECRGRTGVRVLELGCGTGRILIELMKVGIDTVGADRSFPMLMRLRADAKKTKQMPALLQMDIAAPALRGPFQLVLLPYSLITYLTDRAAATWTVRGLAALVALGGCLVLDAFVPQPVQSFAEFRRDYERQHGNGKLERHKRITANADGSNRIERIYRLFDADGMPTEEIATDETIRPYTAADLVRLGADAGLEVDACSWDYGASNDPHKARFASVVLRRRV